MTIVAHHHVERLDETKSRVQLFVLSFRVYYYKEKHVTGKGSAVVAVVVVGGGGVLVNWLLLLLLFVAVDVLLLLLLLLTSVHCFAASVIL